MAAKNLLRALLELPAKSRGRSLHEDAFSDVIRRAGGSRLLDVVRVPDGVKNADYIIPTAGGDVLLELKQLHGENLRGSLAAFFDRKPKRVRVKYFEQLPGNITRINTDALTQEDWTAFHRQFRPNLWEMITKAARQLRETEDLVVSQGRKVVARGIWLLNSGDGDITLDLLARLSLVGIAGEWNRGKFRSVDFAVCSAWDHFDNPNHTINALPQNMAFGPKRSPFDVRPIYRSQDHAAAIAAAQFICEGWTRYCAEAVEADLLPELFREQPVLKMVMRAESPFKNWTPRLPPVEKATFPIELPTKR